MTLNLADMAVTVASAFGSAPIRAEGQAVNYDEVEICEVEAEHDHLECERNVDFGEDNVVEVNDAD